MKHELQLNLKAMHHFKDDFITDFFINKAENIDIIPSMYNV